MAATDSTPPPRVAAHAPVAVTLDRVSLYVERAHARGRSASATGSDAAARLLHDVSARIPAGQLFLVLGGSGSGKSSILHLLALRLPGATYSATGSVLYNAAPADVALRARIAYVQQEVALLPLLTARETLRFAARLRMPADCSAADKAAAVEALIVELGLQEVTDSRVGGARLRGLSGGEARRVSVGVQLLAQPSLLLADEPTTGLDSAAAGALARTLAALAAAGRTVVATLHTPRPEAFAAGDAFMLLCRGRVAYVGAPRDALPHFAALGYDCPRSTAAADFLLDLTSLDTRTPAAETASSARAAALLDDWATREPPCDTASDVRCSTPPPPMPRLSPRASLAEQTRVLTARAALSTLRDTRALLSLLFGAVLLGIADGLIWYDLDGTPGGIVSRTSLAHCVGAQPTYQFLVISLHALCDELMLFDAERADGAYGALSFVFSRVAVLLPQVALFPPLFGLIVYGMTGMRTNSAALGAFLGDMCGVHAVGYALALAAAAASSRRAFSTASLLANTTFVFFRLAGGLMLQLGSIPIWLAWVKRLSFPNFSFRIITNFEFRHRTWPCPAAMANVSAAACLSYSGDATLAHLGVPDDIIDPAAALVISFVSLLVLATALLARQPHGGAAPRMQSLPLLQTEPPVQPRESTTDARCEIVEVLAAAPAEAPTVPPQPPELSSSRAFSPVTLRLCDIGVSLRRTRALPAGRVVLQSISLTLRPWQLTGVMGPSGCGKSTLLGAIAARIRPDEADVSGSIRFNNATLAPAAMRAVVGFVTQDDALLPLLTVFETLHFAARLRLPQGMSAAAKLARVDTVIAELGLKECAGTHIGASAAAAVQGAGGASMGGHSSRGVSGGEKRRVSIAVQMLTDPAVLLCDEPTSGLDAFTALNIGTTLAQLAEREGRTVIASMHQPREGLFSLLSHLVVLARGRIVYAGAGGETAIAYFEARGYKCPQLTNPADFVIDTCAMDMRTDATVAASAARIATLIDLYAAAYESRAAQRISSSETPATAGTSWTDGAAADSGAEVALGMARPMGSLAATTPLLLRRSALHMARRPGALATRLMQGVTFGIVLCMFFTRLSSDPARGAVQNRIGLLFELQTLVFAGMLSCIAIFPAERDVFFRESADGAYGVAPFLLAYTALELLCNIGAALVFAALVGPIAGLGHSPRQFFTLAYALTCMLVTGESVGIAVCSRLEHVGAGVTLTSTVLSVMTAASGFFSIGMPDWLRALNHLSVPRYAANVVAVNELRGLHLGGGASGDAALALYRFNPSQAGRDAVLLGALTIAYRLIAAAVLHGSKSRHV